MWLGKGRMEGGLARMAKQPFFFSGVFLYLGNSVFVNKTLSKNNNKIVDRLPTPI
jgi:hypothetical protein